AFIQSVVSNSPAENAGLQAHDQIVSLAGKSLKSGEWLKILSRYKTGHSVPVVVKRDRRTIKTNMIMGPPERFDYTIEERPDVTAEQKVLRASWLNGIGYKLTQETRF